MSREKSSALPRGDRRDHHRQRVQSLPACRALLQRFAKFTTLFAFALAGEIAKAMADDGRVLSKAQRKRVVFLTSE